MESLQMVYVAEVKMDQTTYENERVVSEELALAEAAHLELIDKGQALIFAGTREDVDTYFIELRDHGIDPEGKATYFSLEEYLANPEKCTEKLRAIDLYRN